MREEVYDRDVPPLRSHCIQPKPYRWMLDVIWLNLVELSRLDTFTQLLDKVNVLKKDRRERERDGGEMDGMDG